MGNNDATSVLARFAAAFQARDRLLRVRFSPSARDLDDALLPERLSGREALHECYRYALECLSADARFDGARLIGEPIEVGIRTAAGGERLVSGLVTNVRALASDGGFARFELVIEPALAVLAHQRIARVFQDQSVPAIVLALLDEHIKGNSVIGRAFHVDASGLTREYPKRSYCTAYRESARDFIERLLAEESMGWGFRFAAAATSANQPQADEPRTDEPPRHTLYLFDDAVRVLGDAVERVRFHEPRMAEARDGHTAWSRMSAVVGGATQLASLDYKTAGVTRGGESRRIDAGETTRGLAATLEHYDPQATYYAGDADELAGYATRRQALSDARAERFAGGGSWREAIAGGVFVLDAHPVHDRESLEQRTFVFASLEIEAESNLPKPLAEMLPGALARVEPKPGYRNRFEALRRGSALAPRYASSTHARPTARGIQIATVVGPRDEEIYTDALGRIRVQFPWQRAQDHVQGTAHNNERASTWVRVMMPAAGGGFGHQFIPRIGQSVVIDFIESDIDRPIVTGVVYDGAHTPPRFAGRGQLPENQALSGLRSKELHASRANHLLFDDTTNELRAQLSSDHAASELNLGYLTHARDAGKAGPRGEGLEARTDGALAVRGARGVLVSAEPQTRANGRQLDRSQLLNEIKTAIDLLTAQSDFAGSHNAIGAQATQAQALKAKLDTWERGTNVERSADATSSAASTPPSNVGVVAVSAPEGIALATPQTLVQSAGQDFDAIAGRNAQIAAGQNLVASAGQAISLSAQGAGLRAIAHRGELLLQSQSGDAVINAAKHLSATATEGEIRLMAGRAITLVTDGGAYITLRGGDIEIGGPGRFVVKSASHSFQGPARGSAALPKFEQSNTQRRYALRCDLGSVTETLLPNAKYRITLDDGAVREGTSDAQGLTDLLEHERARISRIEIPGED